ncbi:MAG: hypothetical protein IT462_16260 [Planctomycetes bacterium]|nr:hypothetical protein [Planctomycetota bacterium]
MPTVAKVHLSTPDAAQYALAALLAVAALTILFATLPGFANPRDLLIPIAATLVCFGPVPIVAGTRMVKAIRLFPGMPKKELGEKLQSQVNAVDYLLIALMLCALVGVFAVLALRISMGLPVPQERQLDSDRLFNVQMGTMYLLFAAQAAYFTRSRRRMVILKASLGGPVDEPPKQQFSSVAERA